jgi:pSer/pThr/pTyr-binding forkhead associated (FHA) protein
LCSSGSVPRGNNLRGRGAAPPGGPSPPASSGGSVRPHKPASQGGGRSGSSQTDDSHAQIGLKIINGDQELGILDNKVTIGRRKECDICLNDPLVSGYHAEIINGFVSDPGSTNGSLLNGQPLKAGVKKMLKAGDKLQIGDRILRIETGKPKNDDDKQELSRSKKFPGGIKDGKDKDDASSSSAAAPSAAEQKEADEDAKLTVEELMDKEFNKIIGHDSLKKQLRQFYKKVQLDQIRINAGKEKDKKRLYHMIFSGPPGTG